MVFVYGQQRKNFVAQRNVISSVHIKAAHHATWSQLWPHGDARISNINISHKQTSDILLHLYTLPFSGALVFTVFSIL